MELTEQVIKRFELIQRTEGTEKAIEDLLYNMLIDE
jgi:hypothetical protein